MKKKVLYLLSGNLSTTPRALQSIQTAKQLFEVKVLSVSRSADWQKIDQQLASELNIDISWISLTRKPLGVWILSSLINKCCEILYPYFQKSLFINAFASSKASVLLFLKSKQIEFDFIISHSSGSIFPAYALARRSKKSFAVDIEDFHPGENITKDVENEKKRRIFILQQILPKARYITYASPLIGEYTLKLLNETPKQSFLIQNSFSKNDFSLKDKLESEKIKFVWFSQYISYKRGLELVIPALAKYDKAVSLTLIGKMDAAFFDEWIKPNLHFIEHKPPMPQTDLHHSLKDFDIGLALEVDAADLNRGLALTNKIFVYAQAGLYILATDTKAQTQFIDKNNCLGEICKQQTEDFVIQIGSIISDIQIIRDHKANRFEYAQRFSWEEESQKLPHVWWGIVH